MLSLSALFLMKVWQISCDVKNNRDGGNHEVDENDDNIKFISSIYLSVYLSIYIENIKLEMLNKTKLNFFTTRKGKKYSM